jgi:protein-ribulosamine 3-kinase
MTVADRVINDIEAKLGLKITGHCPVSGGDINSVFHLQTTAGSFLIKINSLDDFSGMFKKEEQGLAAIRNTNTIAVPEVILQSDNGNESYLMMEWIDTQNGDEVSSQTLGRQLAQMHRYTSTQFGFDIDNYMGSLYQSNSWHSTWIQFFIEERLQPMLKMAVDKKELSKNDINLFEELYKKLSALFTEEPPALVHGDLWSGNYLISAAGTPYLIDPAVSYSNREFDIAMTTLFGGFDGSFYEAYIDEFPLQQGWQQRLQLWNLYPLLVHVNLFGGGYATQVRRILRTI